MNDADAADALLSLSEMTGRVAALMGGYKTQLVRYGISDETAEGMVADYHHEWIRKVLNRPASEA